MINNSANTNLSHVQCASESLSLGSGMNQNESYNPLPATSPETLSTAITIIVTKLRARIPTTNFNDSLCYFLSALLAWEKAITKKIDDLFNVI